MGNRRTIRGGAALLLGMLLLSGAAGATIRHVPDPYPTIQAGIDACAPGDTVLVATGVYEENLVFGDDDITVASYYLTTGDPSFIESTEIHAALAGPPVVLIAGGQTPATRLCGFTIGNGSGPDGSGIKCLETSPTIEHNTITSNCPAFDGGGIYVDQGSPVITHNTITGN